MMTLAEAQLDIRRAYVGGGPGAFVSALVWLAAGLVERSQGSATAFTVLFFGGMLIYPGGLLVEKLFFRRPAPRKDNALGLIALESTIAMIGCLFAAWLLLRFEPAFVFPVAAIAVGTHYFAFKSVYGDRTYWVMAAAITAVGFAGLYWPDRIPGGLIFAVTVVEAVFAVILTLRAPK
jgi:hypothetical protein